MSELCFSFVTGTRNRPEAIARFIRSIADHVDASFELLIGDASDRPGGLGRRLAPAVGAHLFHHRLEDEQRVGHAAHFVQDNARLRSIWHPRRRELRRRYRRSSFRYFRDLETRQSPTFQSDALVVPTTAEETARPRASTHRVRAHGWWLGI